MNGINGMRFQKGDILAVALVLVLAVCVMVCFLPKDEAGDSIAQIYQNGECIKTVDLNTQQSFRIAGRYTNTVTVEDGTIAITESDCPGEDCVHSGAISSSGRSIVCLPNGVEVRVTAGASDVDFVVG